MKARNILYLLLTIIWFPILISAELSIVGALLAAAILAVPAYFFCFVLKLPVWQFSKRKKPTKAAVTAKVEALETAKKAESEGIVL